MLIFVVFVSDLKEVKIQGVTLDNYILLCEYAYVIPIEILGILSQYDIEFCIDLIPRVDPIRWEN